ncbi:carbohydrate sulfotransferase 1-like [Amphiura filiformis]|uniref:carbohydrate sulfotransferase 1-like n=1 Tax=Amphiura filiformis TaxID=82378 RepID=UPI003B21B248
MKWQRFFLLGSVGLVSICILLSTVRNLVSINTNCPLSRVDKTTLQPTWPKNRVTSSNLSLNRDNKVHVIIFTRWKYGSTFTGEILNNNPDFTYFFEPIRREVYKNRKIHRGVFYQDLIPMLHNTLKCEFIDKNYTWWDEENKSLDCRYSKKLQNSILCEKSTIEKRDISAYLSKESRSRMVEEICRSVQHVAIKTVRVPDLKHLKSIVTDDSLNVKVIQLVRDPRGVYLSRKVTSDVCDMELSECDELKNNLNYWKDPPFWLKGRYMLLRYEDLADDPIEMVHIIYDFLGLPVPETVKSWLRINILKMSSSSKSAYSWRTKITYKTMVTVQRYCMDLLLMAGYKPVNSEKDLTNLKIPSIRKFSYPLMPNITFGVAKPNTV